MKVQNDSDKSQSAQDSLTVLAQHYNIHYQNVVTLSSDFHFVSGYLHFTTHKSTTLVP